MHTRLMLAFMTLFFILPGCAPKVKLFAAQSTEPLKEFVIQGNGDGKLALIHLSGFLETQPKQGILRAKPSQVQELTSMLRLAEKDEQVKGVVIAIDSPGGTTTASDILYHEIADFKRRTGKKVVAAMMDVAASGGYYAALPADWILAHPTTITGSVGVIFLRPKVQGLFDKIGVEVEISKSGRDKDMGSPFRPTTPEEEALLQAIIDDFAGRFHMLVARHRKLTPANMETVKTARVFTAKQAKAVGLIDQVGYIQDAFAKSIEISGLSKNAQVVAYRRDTYPDDNPYNTMTATGVGKLNLLGVDTGLLMPPKAGFYYVWPQGVAE